jgi:hypothetical protein
MVAEKQDKKRILASIEWDLDESESSQVPEHRFRRLKEGCRPELPVLAPNKPSSKRVRHTLSETTEDLPSIADEPRKTRIVSVPPCLCYDAERTNANDT